MYYLLNDNSIIDSENLPKNVKIERIAKDDKGNAFFIQIQHLDFLKTRKTGYVKKQSENVYDLIEDGDLLKIKQPKESPERNVFAEYDEQKNNYVSFIKDCFPNKITAIYKPDAQRNYIKAWEKKDDR